MKHIALIGASGGIGAALLQHLAEDSDCVIHAFSRREITLPSTNVYWHYLDLTYEDSIAAAAQSIDSDITFDSILIASGLLHSDAVKPEKSLRDICAESFAEVFSINCTGPALVAKHFLPKLATDRRAVFAALSARVGSISDNALGGWYAYRASKAALNIIIKNLSIEFGRRHKQAIIVGLHPGTVDTALSAPFQAHVPSGKLFSPQQSAGYLLRTLSTLTPSDSGKCFDWDSKEILP